MKEAFLREKGELVETCGQTVLFLQTRVNREDVPAGLNAYDVREDDYGMGVAVSVEDHVLVNHMGTILTHAPIVLDESTPGRRSKNLVPNFKAPPEFDENCENYAEAEGDWLDEIDPDWNYTGEEMTVSAFTKN